MIVLSLLAVLVPILLMVVYLRYIPSFEQYLEKLAHSEAGKGRERGRFDRFWPKSYAGPARNRHVSGYQPAC